MTNLFTNVPLGPDADASNPNKVEAKVIKVGPETAKLWLARNLNNRTITRSAVETIKSDILAGRWRLSGQTISFDPQGILMDGQKRLTAIVETGIACDILVAGEVPPDSYSTYDIIQRRTLGQQLHHEGYQSYINLGSAVNYLWKYENGKMESNEALPSHAALLEDTLVRHPKLTESVAFIEPLNKLRLAPHGGLSMLHYIASQLFVTSARQVADRFFESLLIGGSLKPGEPIFALRERLLHGSRNGGGASGRAPIKSARMQPTEKLAFIVKTWNAVREGRPLKVLRWATRGEGAEKFPRMI